MSITGTADLGSTSQAEPFLLEELDFGSLAESPLAMHTCMNCHPPGHCGPSACCMDLSEEAEEGSDRVGEGSE
jgi:hypothetical protein